MNILVFSFHKMINMHIDYAYQFSNFIIYKKPRIDVCVVCLHCALKESNDLLQSTIVVTYSQFNSNICVFYVFLGF
jgi:hypothetical protein